MEVVVVVAGVAEVRRAAAAVREALLAGDAAPLALVVGAPGGACAVGLRGVVEAAEALGQDLHAGHGVAVVCAVGLFQQQAEAADLLEALAAEVIARPGDRIEAPSGGDLKMAPRQRSANWNHSNSAKASAASDVPGIAGGRKSKAATLDLEIDAAPVLPRVRSFS